MVLADEIRRAVLASNGGSADDALYRAAVPRGRHTRPARYWIRPRMGQRRMERLVKSHAKARGPRLSAAMIVVDHVTKVISIWMTGLTNHRFDKIIIDFTMFYPIVIMTSRRNIARFGHCNESGVWYV